LSFLLLFPSVSISPAGLITFRRYRPLPRYPPINSSWTKARVDFWPDTVMAALPADNDPLWVFGTEFTLSHIDSDPTHPQAQTVSVISSGEGWYRLVFVDAADNEDRSAPLVKFPRDVLIWRPLPDDIAQVCPAYTRHRIDDEEEDAGAEQGTFDDLTDPTVAQVEGMIDNAMREIVGRVPLDALGLNAYAEGARQTAIWHAAATLEAEKASEQAMDADGPAKWKQSSYVACLNDLIASIPTSLRLV
jgi:hypothetical protein